MIKKNGIIRPRSSRVLKGGAYPARMRHTLVRCKDKKNIMVGVDADDERGGLIKIIIDGKVRHKIPIQAREQIIMEINRAFGFDRHRVDQVLPTGEIFISKV